MVNRGDSRHNRACFLENFAGLIVWISGPERRNSRSSLIRLRVHGTAGLWIHAFFVDDQRLLSSFRSGFVVELAVGAFGEVLAGHGDLTFSSVLSGHEPADAHVTRLFQVESVLADDGDLSDLLRLPIRAGCFTTWTFLVQTLSSHFLILLVAVHIRWNRWCRRRNVQTSWIKLELTRLPS